MPRKWLFAGLMGLLVQPGAVGTGFVVEKHLWHKTLRQEIPVRKN